MTTPRLHPWVALVSAAAGLGSRLASWWWDYLVVLAWLAAVFVLIGGPQLAGWWDLSEVWTTQWSADLAITVLTVLPYFLYLVVSEFRYPHATWGKTRAGLRVAGSEGGSPQLSAVITRNLVKVLPWQFGHMGAVRLIATSGADPVGTWLAAASMVVLVAVVGPVLLGKPGAHDLLAKTRVVT